MFQLFRLIAVLLLLICIQSCQPELSEPSVPDPEAADSTLLVKSLRIVTSVSNGAFIQENYTYDTVNRKITLSWTSDDPDATALNGASAVLSYDTDHRLTNIKYNFVPGTTEDDDEKETSIFYDAAGVLQKIEILQQDGDLQIIPFTRLPLASGYMLKWKSEEFPGNLIDRTGLFNNDGLCIKSTRRYADYDAITGDIINAVHYTDSSIYDNNGSLVRLYSIREDSAMGWRDEGMIAEIDERFTNGNNLYLQRKLLLGNGLLNMPFEEGVDIFRPLISLLGFSLWYEPYNYSRMPVKRGKHETFSGLEPYVLTATIDSIGRMKNYDALMFDGMQETIRIDIQYYK